MLIIRACSCGSSVGIQYVSISHSFVAALLQRSAHEQRDVGDRLQVGGDGLVGVDDVDLDLLDHELVGVVQLEVGALRRDEVHASKCLVALGVFGRADLTSLGVDACASLSFAFHDFACGLGWHM